MEAVTESTSVRKVNRTVAGILFIFVFLYCVDVFLVIVPWLSYSVPGVTNLGILTTTTFSAIYCYICCMLTDPGRVPADYRPDEEASPAIVEVKKKGGVARFCQKCVHHKPPRSHHCRVCQRCVLRMDHHCPWVNNCIGHANYKAFLLLLIYATSAIIHTLGLLLSHAAYTLSTSRANQIIRTGPGSKPIELQQGGLQSIWLWALVHTVAIAAALPITIGLVMLLVWHVHLVWTNKTTIEYHEGVTAQIRAAAGAGGQYQHPYDIGPCGNIHEVLGQVATSWVMPDWEGTSGGTKYPTMFDRPDSRQGSSDLGFR